MFSRSTAVTAFGLGGALLPGGNLDWGDLAASLVLVVVVVGVAVVVLWLPWRRLPGWATIVPPLAYVGFVALLLASQGGVARRAPRRCCSSPSCGLRASTVGGSRRWSLSPSSLCWWGCRRPDISAVAVTVRRVVLWGAVERRDLAAVQQPRGRMWKMVRERRELLHEARAIEAASEELSRLRDPREVIMVEGHVSPLRWHPRHHRLGGSANSCGQ